MLAVVTGRNRGLGLETCRQLAGRGMRVVLASRDLARGERAARELGVEAPATGRRRPRGRPTGEFFLDGRAVGLVAAEFRGGFHVREDARRNAGVLPVPLL